MTNKIYDIVTEKIIAQLEAGIIPWERPWQPTDAPHNIRGTRYTGINTFLLQCTHDAAGYKSNAWLTYKQATEAGGNVKGESATLVIYASTYKLTDANGTPKINTAGKQETGFSLRYYNVFNSDQVKGIKLPAAETDKAEFNPIEAAELILKSYPAAPSIRYGGDSAHYSPALDYVQMPRMNLFISAEHYYSTLFHELGHSTGHTSRLDRWTPGHSHNFGSKDYSKEELIAEMTAAYLMGATGIQAPSTERNTIAYLQSWINALKNDTSLIVKAASAAQKAADHIQNIHTHPTEE